MCAPFNNGGWVGGDEVEWASACGGCWWMGDLWVALGVLEVACGVLSVRGPFRSRVPAGRLLACWCSMFAFGNACNAYVHVFECALKTSLVACT